MAHYFDETVTDGNGKDYEVSIEVLNDSVALFGSYSQGIVGCPFDECGYIAHVTRRSAVSGAKSGAKEKLGNHLKSKTNKYHA